MTKIPLLSGLEVIKALHRLGFRTAHKTKGGHVILKRGNRGCSVPLHPEIAKGTLNSILKQAGVSKEDFLAAL